MTCSLADAALSWRTGATANVRGRRKFSAGRKLADGKRSN
jgi:hypothetical protein